MDAPHGGALGGCVLARMTGAAVPGAAGGEPEALDDCASVGSLPSRGVGGWLPNSGLAFVFLPGPPSHSLSLAADRSSNLA
jgi:hypothetical protein